LIAGIYLAVNISDMPPRLLTIMGKAMLTIFLLSATVVCARLASGVINLNAKKAEGVFESTSILVNIVEFTVYAVGGMVILQSLNISITPILTALGVGGLAMALALQDTLANLVAGIHILLAKRIAPGDYVRLSSGEEGHITDINWRDTTLKALTNHIIIVPNSQISSAIVTNFALPDKEIVIVVPVMVSYENDLSHVERVAIEVATSVVNEMPGGVPDFTPVVRFSSFEDSNINFNIILRGKEFISTGPIRHELIKRLYARFNKEGITISRPIRIVRNEFKSQSND
jgi:small-conductance mechanosensitive channel